jgi:hypothetical protein
MTLSTVSSIGVIYADHVFLCDFGLDSQSILCPYTQLQKSNSVYTISRLTIQLNTDDNPIIEKEVCIKLQGLNFAG